MSRPGPLQELPIHLYAHDHRGSPTLKRPLPPDTPPGQHPKRRFLESPSRSANTPGLLKASRYAQKVDYSSVLNGPESPARVLNFGADEPTTPRSKSSQSQDTPLIPSPKMKLSSGPTASTSAGTAKPPAPAPRHPIVFDLVPRMLPPPTDPESDHYPGFVIYRDPYQLVARRDESRTLESLPDPDGYMHKENTTPPREFKTPASQLTTIPPGSPMVISPEKGKQRMIIDGTAQLSLSQKRIFANGFEDDLFDLSGSPYGLHRLSRMSSRALDDTAPSHSSPLWQTHSWRRNC